MRKGNLINGGVGVGGCCFAGSREGDVKTKMKVKDEFYEVPLNELAGKRAEHI